MRRTLARLTVIATVTTIVGFICSVVALACRIGAFMLSQKIHPGEEQHQGAVGKVIMRKGGE